MSMPHDPNNPNQQFGPGQSVGGSGQPPQPPDVHARRFEGLGLPAPRLVVADGTGHRHPDPAAGRGDGSGSGGGSGGPFRPYSRSRR